MSESGPVSLKEADPFAKRILSSDAFGGRGERKERSRRIFKFLYDQWGNDPGTKTNQDALATHLGLSEEGDLVKVRQAVESLRYKLLPAYTRQHPDDEIIFEIPLREYRLGVRRRHPPKYEENIKFLFQNRNHPDDWLYRIVCKSEGDVLFASISSRHTLDDKILPWFAQGLVKAKHFRVLTWRPQKEYSDGAIRALADHLGHSPESFRSNMDYAWRMWRNLQKEHPFVEVYGYSPVPTAQVVCNDEYLKLELLPLNRPKLRGYHESGFTENRPGLLINARQKSYWIVRDWFEDLWLDAMAKTPNNLVEKRWQKTRLELLRKRGLLLKS